MCCSSEQGELRKHPRCCTPDIARLTVDGDGHALGQNIAVGALESRNLAELVELQVVGADALAGLGVDALQLQAIGLGDGEDGGGARVLLCGTRYTLASCDMEAAGRGGGGGDSREVVEEDVRDKSRSCRRGPSQRSWVVVMLTQLVARLRWLGGV